MGRHDMTVIITDKKVARERITGSWCEHAFLVKYAERICELWAVNAGKRNNQDWGWLDVALASCQLLITAEPVCSWGSQYDARCHGNSRADRRRNASYFSGPTQFNSHRSNLWVVSGGWAQAVESWYYRNKLLWDHQLSMQIFFERCLSETETFIVLHKLVLFKCGCLPRNKATIVMCAHFFPLFSYVRKISKLYCTRYIANELNTAFLLCTKSIFCIRIFFFFFFVAKQKNVQVR